MLEPVADAYVHFNCSILDLHTPLPILIFARKNLQTETGIKTEQVKKNLASHQHQKFFSLKNKNWIF